MKVYGYMNEYVMVAYSELLLKEHFYSKHNLHKHIMYIEASVSFNLIPLPFFKY